MFERIRNWLSRDEDREDRGGRPPVLGAGGEHRRQPAAQYVSALLSEVTRRQGSLLMSPTQAMPCLEGMRASMVPGYEQVTNRLKVMAGMPPMHLPEPVDAEFRHTTHAGNFVIHVRFDDGATPSCRLTSARA